MASGNPQVLTQKAIMYFPQLHAWEDMWTALQSGALTQSQLDADMALIASLKANTVFVEPHVRAGAFDYPVPTAPEMAALAQVLNSAHTHGLGVHLRLFNRGDGSFRYTDITGSQTWVRAIWQYIATTSNVPVNPVTSIQVQNESNSAQTTVDPNFEAWACAMLPYIRTLTVGLPIGISFSFSHADATHDGLDGLRAMVAAIGAVQYDFVEMHLYKPPETAYNFMAPALQAVPAGVPIWVAETGISSDAKDTAPVTLGGAALGGADAGFSLPKGYPATASVSQAYQAYHVRLVAAASYALGFGFPAFWQLFDFTTTSIPSAVGGAYYNPAAPDFHEYHMGLVAADGLGTLKPSGKAYQQVFTGGARPDFCGADIDSTLNGTFDQQVLDESANPWPAYWGTQFCGIQSGADQVDGTALLDTTVGHRHTPSLSIKACVTTDNVNRWPAWRIGVHIPNWTPSTVYTASAWIQSSNGGTVANTGACLKLVWVDRLGNQVQVDASNHIRGTQAWSFFTVTSAVPAATVLSTAGLPAHSCRLHCAVDCFGSDMTSAGQFWWDEVTFSPKS